MFTGSSVGDNICFFFSIKQSMELYLWGFSVKYFLSVIASYLWMHLKLWTWKIFASVIVTADNSFSWRKLTSTKWQIPLSVYCITDKQFGESYKQLTPSKDVVHEETVYKYVYFLDIPSTFNEKNSFSNNEDTNADDRPIASKTNRPDTFCSPRDLSVSTGCSQSLKAFKIHLFI